MLSSEKKQKSFIVVHAGAGHHSAENEEKYLKACRMACAAAMQCLKSGQSAIDAVTVAVKSLEDSPCTNAGVGSNLTLDGHVECDAGLMDGRSLVFGAVGSVSGVKNPVDVAHKLVVLQLQGVMSLGRIPPSVMVGAGAHHWARQHGMQCVSRDALITDVARRTYNKYKRKLNSVSDCVENKKYKTMTNHSRKEIPHIDSSHKRTESSNILIYENRSSTTSQNQTSVSVSSQGSSGSHNIIGACSYKHDALQNKDILHSKLKEPKSNGLDSCVQGTRIANSELQNTKVPDTNVVSTDILDVDIQDIKVNDTDILDTDAEDSRDQNTDTQETVGDVYFDQQDSGVQDTVGDVYVEQQKVQDTINDVCVDHQDSEVQDTAGDVYFEQQQTGVQDTVGAVCVDQAGNMAAAASSGGIWLKQMGRLGPAAVFGAGCWAHNGVKDKTPGVAVATSGCGEQLMKTLLAKQCGDALQKGDDGCLTFKQVLEEGFLKSEFLKGIQDKNAGMLGLVFDQTYPSGDSGGALGTPSSVEVLWGHTTSSMCIGYMSEINHKPKALISRLPLGSSPGVSFSVQGKLFMI